MISKEERYAALVSERKECRLCVGLTNPADVQGGALDADEIGPWSRWQGNLSADLMIIGKDWQTADYFTNTRVGTKGSRPTTRSLRC